jgi:hypothetical protein
MPHDPTNDDESWRDEIADDDTPGVTERRLRVVGAHETRPDILCGPAVHETTDAMAKVLAEHDPHLYQRARALVHVIRADESTPAVCVGSPVVREAPLSWLTMRVSRSARCVRRVRGKRGESFVPVSPPGPCVRAVLEAGEWSGVRHLRGVVEAPVMRPDGSILQSAGYDALTGYLYEPNAAFAPVADKPTHSDAVAAFARLLEPLREFPYVNEAHRSAVIAATLTLLARPAIDGAVPAWVFDASSRRSGKSLQVDVVHLICTGRPASRMTFPEQDEELEKVLSAYALMGARSVNFDNVARKFGGAALDKVITAVGSVDLRVLGSTDLRTCEWYATVFASGNNVTFGGDMIARVLAPRLETALDRPELLEPEIKDLRAWVRAHRVELVRAALTILRAYVVAGSPDMGCPRWGGFEAWSRLVPHALVWVGAADPMGARRGLDGDADPDELAHAGLVEGWARLCAFASKPEGLTIKQALSLLYPSDRHREDGPPDGFGDLREVIETITSARPGFTPSGKSLGDKVRRWRDKRVGGRYLTGEVGHAGTIRWRVPHPR